MNLDTEGHSIKEIKIVGWSSWSARQAHNLEVGGSNPSPATKIKMNKYGKIC